MAHGAAAWAWEPPSRGARVSETEIGVRSYELDSFGHVNHARFLNYFEHGRFQALRDWGFPYEELVGRGWGVYVVRIEVDYLKEARLGQRLRIRTWTLGFRRTSMVLAQDIHGGDDGAEVARALVTAVFVGEDRRPMRVPDPVRHAFTGGDP
jgi:YbgC/YbaW family acyl-CoA thioester hydrolase